MLIRASESFSILLSSRAGKHWSLIPFRLPDLLFLSSPNPFQLILPPLTPLIKPRLISFNGFFPSPPSIFLAINLFSSFMDWLKSQKLKISSLSQTDFTMEPKNSSISNDRGPCKTTAASSAHARPNRKSTASSAMVMKPNGKSAVSSAILKKPNASTAVSSAHDDQVMFFRDVSLGPTEAVLRFRLVHFWEATRKPSLDRRWS